MQDVDKYTEYNPIFINKIIQNEKKYLYKYDCVYDLVILASSEDVYKSDHIWCEWQWTHGTGKGWQTTARTKGSTRKLSDKCNPINIILCICSQRYERVLHTVFMLVYLLRGISGNSYILA